MNETTIPTYRNCPLSIEADHDRPLKRKLREIMFPVTGERSVGYPSPPMSGPPTPSQAPPRSDGHYSQAPIATSRPEPPSPFPLFNPPAPQLPTPSYFAQPPGTFGYVTTAQSQYSYGQPIEETGSASIARPAGSAAVETATAGAAPGTRPGRKPKAHVASACVNCKRAHLSCDVQRPCARCVTSGKQDTCFDVQHKKRGRPRLREEGEFRLDPPSSDPPSAGPTRSGPSHPPTSRQILGTRNRRAESFRSIQSFASEDSAGYLVSPPAFAPSSSLQSPFLYSRGPPILPDRSPYEVPTALLSSDFLILRANRPFEQIITGGRDVRGRQLAEVIAPADNESFLSIRNQLRAEREAREPAYMAPIMHPGQDPVQNVSDADVEQFTQGFGEQTYRWTQTQLGSAAQSFPARVRLAKAAVYFIVVTLPSFRPIEPPAMQPRVPMYGGPLILGPPLQPSSAFMPRRQSLTQSTPPASYFPPQQPQPSSYPNYATAPTYPLPQPQPPYQQSMYPPVQPMPSPAARLSIAEPPTDTNIYTPRLGPTQPSQLRSAPAMQLPPLVAGPTSMPARLPAERTSSSEADETGERRSPKKRRRMGIDDVLH